MVTFSEYFLYENNILQLQHPYYKGGFLNFAPQPFHCGSSFRLTTQSNDFSNDYSNTVNKIHTNKK